MDATNSIVRFALLVTLGSMLLTAKAQGESEALLISYPDYVIDVYYGNVDGVGHAGVLLISPTGFTRYYEFGRYPPGELGRVRNQTVPNAQIGADGRATEASLQEILSKLSTESGKNGRIRAAYFINMDFDKMDAQANSEQPVYDIVRFNCGHYAELVVLEGHPLVDRPTILNPTPNNLVDEYIEEGNAEVLFTPGAGYVTIGVGDEADAKE